MFLWFPVLDLARAPRRTARKKGSGYENGTRASEPRKGPGYEVEPYVASVFPSYLARFD
jgi:hypothetical protein